MIAAGVEYIRTFSLDYIIVPATFCLNGIITGSGHTIISSVGGIMASLGFRIPLAIIFGVVLDKGLMGLGIAAPAASLGAGTLLFIYYILGKWKKSTVVQKQIP